MPPRHAGDRQRAVEQKRPRVDVGPAHDPRIGDHERIDADDGPCRLLAGHATRIRPTRSFARESLERGIRRGAKPRVLDLQLGHAVARCRSGVEDEAHEPRFRLGEPHDVGAAAAVEHLAYRPPLRAVVGKLDIVARGVRVWEPADDQTAELPEALEIDGECLSPARGAVALPRGRGAAVDGQRCRRAGQGGRRVRRRRRGGGLRG